eukprot:982432-Rhodomonas_salina.1
MRVSSTQSTAWRISDARCNDCLLSAVSAVAAEKTLAQDCGPSFLQTSKCVVSGMAWGSESASENAQSSTSPSSTALQQHAACDKADAAHRHCHGRLARRRQQA